MRGSTLFNKISSDFNYFILYLYFLIFITDKPITSCNIKALNHLYLSFLINCTLLQFNRERKIPLPIL